MVFAGEPTTIAVRKLIVMVAKLTTIGIMAHCQLILRQSGMSRASAKSALQNAMAVPRESWSQIPNCGNCVKKPLRLQRNVAAKISRTPCFKDVALRELISSILVIRVSNGRVSCKRRALEKVTLFSESPCRVVIFLNYRDHNPSAVIACPHSSGIRQKLTSPIGHSMFGHSIYSKSAFLYKPTL